MQIQFNTGVCTILLVKVPEYARNFIIRVSEKVYPGNNILCYQTPERWDRYGKENWDWETRSEANLTFIGLSHELTEEQCKSIVLKMPWGNDCYKNYELIDKPQFVGLNTKESFESILRHLKIKDDNEIFAVLRLEE